MHTLTSDHIGNLDDRVDICLRENTFSSSTLDIETEDPQWCNLLPVSFGSMRDESVKP